MTPSPVLVATASLQDPATASTPSPEAPLDLWQLLSDPQLWAEKAMAFLPNVGKALGVLVVIGVLLFVSLPALRKILERGKVEPGLSRFLVDTLYRWLVILVALVMAAAQLGVDVGAAIAGLGILGIAVGLAAQDSLTNAIAGITIFMDKPFIVNDWITAGDVTGRVAEIKVRTTRIRTRNNTYLVVPNKHIIENTLMNLSLHGDMRVEIPIGIAYKEDVRAARRVILSAIEDVSLIRPHRSDVVLESLGDSSINLSLRVWVEEPEKERQARFACLELAKNALDKAGIQIPFPHLQMFLERLEPAAVEGLRSALGVPAPDDSEATQPS